MIKLKIECGIMCLNYLITRFPAHLSFRIYCYGSELKVVIRKVWISAFVMRKQNAIKRIGAIGNELKVAALAAS